MGLSIHWELSLDSADADQARQRVAALRAAAENAGFAELGEVVEAWSDRHVAGEVAAADRAWALSQGLTTVTVVEGAGTRQVKVAPAHVLAFRAYSFGAEEAAFGLATYPPAAADGTPTGLSGYRWSAGCSTQGAAKRGGPPAFLRAHRALIAVLDKARSLGLKVTAKDDGTFWTTRDPKALLDKLDEWESLTVALKQNRRTESARLAADVRDKLEELKRQRKRHDREPSPDLEG